MHCLANANIKYYRCKFTWMSGLSVSNRNTISSIRKSSLQYAHSHIQHSNVQLTENVIIFAQKCGSSK